MDSRDKEEIISAINERDWKVYDNFKDYMDRSVKGFSQQLAQFEERNAHQHHEIIEHQKETNGRVTCLEKENGETVDNFTIGATILIKPSVIT